MPPHLLTMFKKEAIEYVKGTLDIERSESFWFYYDTTREIVNSELSKEELAFAEELSLYMETWGEPFTRSKYFNYTKNFKQNHRWMLLEMQVDI